jgi:hypothetical protein
LCLLQVTAAPTFTLRNRKLERTLYAHGRSKGSDILCHRGRVLIGHPTDLCASTGGRNLLQAVLSRQQPLDGLSGAANKPKKYLRVIREQSRSLPISRLLVTYQANFREACFRTRVPLDVGAGDHSKECSPLRPRRVRKPAQNFSNENPVKGCLP